MYVKLPFLLLFSMPLLIVFLFHVLAHYYVSVVPYGHIFIAMTSSRQLVYLSLLLIALLSRLSYFLFPFFSLSHLPSVHLYVCLCCH